MVSIVHDYTAIAAAMKGDGWYQKAKPPEVPKPEGVAGAKLVTAMGQSSLQKAADVERLRVKMPRDILRQEMEELRRKMLEFMQIAHPSRFMLPTDKGDL